jgi:hypothetical protein
MLTRRSLLCQLSFPWLASVARGETRRPRILLRSSWQVVNIGDIAHTPGVLALLEKHFPEAEVRLWASADLSPEVAAMEHRRFPNLRIVKGVVGADGKAGNAELAETLAWADFLLHGSGPSLVGAKDVTAWRKHLGKPYGVFGITRAAGGGAELLSQAKFVYFRDSVSLAAAKRDGVKSSVMEFGPDGAFACDLAAEAKADSFLKANALEPGQFLCCLTRLRHTPYWLVKKGVALDAAKQARNEAMQEHDHKPIREAIIQVVRQTKLKVLLCPEDSTQMQVGKSNLYDQLPDDVKPRVVWRKDFWLTDEALSVYRKSAGVFGSEMHSPIMAIGAGIPAIVCRFAEQTSKGLMWQDIGLGEWLFDLDVPADHDKLAPAVLKMAQEPEWARKKAAAARENVATLQKAMVEQLRSCFSP